ncbi:reverse transcriptase domain-containing protein [Shouchella miscanthi]|uniref:Reverse transcriptase domain-containing protein n=1 Tax=Shouchella miscanthi TaxID=2598861 RepID=A0ABU6NR82_9BACI|nr:reverse transcriptase domain-containing protein [Shouchella miscanthi]
MYSFTESTRLFSVDKLEDTFNTFIKSNSALGIDKMTYEYFSNNKLDLLNYINVKISNDTYNFTPYKEKLIVKSRSSYPRLISIPTLKDKLVLKSIHIELTKIYDEIKQPLPQECVQEIKSSIHLFSHFIKLDIANFYGNIKHGILIDKLNRKNMTNGLLTLISKAITTQTVPSNDSNDFEIITQGIPQGLSISNILANIYLHDLDMQFGNRDDIKYIRYVDDILILCNKDNYERIYKEIKYEVEGIYNLSLNTTKEEKGLIKELGFAFLGYAVKDFGKAIPKLTVREANKKRFEDSIVMLFSKYKFSNKMSPEQFIFSLNNKITGSVSKKVSGDESKDYKYGWLFYFSQMEDTGYLYHLDWLIDKLLNKQNFNHLNKSNVKSFVKAFYEIKYNFKESNYIHKPDSLPIEEKKRLLIDIFKIPERTLIDPRTIDKQYKRLVYKPISEYEKDIKNLIS